MPCPAPSTQPQVREYLREKEELRLQQQSQAAAGGALAPYPRPVSPRMLLRPGSPGAMAMGLKGPVMLQPAYPVASAHYGLPAQGG